MKDQIAIRSAAPGDDAALAGIAAVVQQLHFVERPDVFKAVDVDALTAWFGRALRNDQRRILLAEAQGAAVGYAVVQDGERDEDPFAHPRRWREVDQLAVVPTYRQRGVARALIEHIAASASADGVPGLELNTWAFNKAAHAAFQRLGFVERSMRYERR
jgi:ribosomal protein S18 acetylase RimI-like enzyme